MAFMSWLLGYTDVETFGHGQEQIEIEAPEDQEQFYDALEPPALQISAHCNQHLRDELWEEDGFPMSTSSRETSVEKEHDEEDNNTTTTTHLETIYTICNLTSQVYDVLPSFQQEWIDNFRRKSDDFNRSSPGKFSAIVCVPSEDEAMSNARQTYNEPYDLTSLKYWTDGAWQPKLPRCASGGIVYETERGDWSCTSTSYDIRDVSGSYDTELLTLIRTARLGLHEAERRFHLGIYVSEVIISLDPMFLLKRLSRLYKSDKLSPAFEELFAILELYDKAHIHLRIYYCPKRTQILPHVLADDVAREQNREATAAARSEMERWEFEVLEAVEPIRDYTLYTDGIERQAELDKEAELRRRRQREYTRKRGFAGESEGEERDGKRRRLSDFV